MTAPLFANARETLGKLIAKWLSQRPNAPRGSHQIGTRPGGDVFRAPTHQSRSCA